MKHLKMNFKLIIHSTYIPVTISYIRVKVPVVL